MKNGPELHQNYISPLMASFHAKRIDENMPSITSKLHQPSDDILLREED